MQKWQCARRDGWLGGSLPLRYNPGSQTETLQKNDMPSETSKTGMVFSVGLVRLQHLPKRQAAMLDSSRAKTQRPLQVGEGEGVVEPRARGPKAHRVPGDRLRRNCEIDRPRPGRRKLGRGLGKEEAHFGGGGGGGDGCGSAV